MNDKVQEILNEVGKVIRGKDEAIELVMTAMLAKGHILVEDVPGVGKNNTGGCFFPCDGVDRAPSAVYTGRTSE